MVERSLSSAGMATGRYTSPHLTNLEERIALGGRPVAADVLDDALEHVRLAATALGSPPTFFEATTAAALRIFADAGVDIAVLEVGLGGRLDATNVVEPVASAITAVDLDHTAQLGGTLEAIAREKAGIVRAGAPVVLARNPPEVCDAVRAVAKAAGARLVEVAGDSRVEAEFEAGRATLTLATPHGRYDRARLGLRGRHQIDNAVTAVRLVEELSAATGLLVGPTAIRAGLEDAVWPARLEQLSWQGHEVLLDGAHNPGGARALAAYVREVYGRPLPMVVAVMRDKAIEDMLAALAPAASRLVVTAPTSARAMQADDLASHARSVLPNLTVDVVPRPADALARAVSYGAPVVVAGSLFLAGEIRPLLS
jgi:dihydrofolate synthase/folylpolyglutamate synthase